MTTPETLRDRALRLGMYGLLLHWDEIAEEHWLSWVIEVEETERDRRSLQRRLANARLGRFKPLADFDWDWPRRIDRVLVEELMALRFIDEAANVVIAGPNGTGKTMLAKNIAHAALMAGATVQCVTASEMLNKLAAEDSANALERRLRRLCRPKILYIDEVGYLSYGNRHADLLFEVVTRRYAARKPIIITTNKAFSEWNDVFPSAACVVTLIDRLVHRSEVLDIEGESYRLKEAKERKERRAKERASGKKR
jgi:DNA replication protein DnaC